VRQKLSEIEINKLRQTMGTLPESQPKRSDEIFVGVEDIRVKLIDYPHNPYASIFSLVTSTWSGRDKWWDRWKNATVEGRVKVVTAALEGKTLQQSLETPSFTFQIEGLSRSAYDQLVRARQSAVGSVGLRDNSHLDAALRLPKDMLKVVDKYQFESWWRQTKDLYEAIIQSGESSWQSARAILPMGMCWRFTWAMNYRSFKEICAQRLSFCEQSDTCFTVWAMWATLWRKFPLLASFCRPRCDFMKRCYYSDIYSLSNLFGALFAPCQRWPVKDYTATFKNGSAADPKEINEQLLKQYRIGVPSPDVWENFVKVGIAKDRKYFEAK